MAYNKETGDFTKGKREIPYILAIVFLAVSFIIVFAGYTYYRSYKKTLFNNFKNELISICDLKVNKKISLCAINTSKSCRIRESCSP